jgi:transcriptional regulator with XRE-family HTH domain
VVPTVKAIEEREALVLTAFEGLAQEELAKRLGISLSGAKSRVQRGREQLKEMLLDFCEREFGHTPGHLTVSVWAGASSGSEKTGLEAEARSAPEQTERIEMNSLA